jgi:arsenate reductase (glutaredoxin)
MVISTPLSKLFSWNLPENNAGMLKIYHNPRCAKSRAALHYLTQHSYEFEVIHYLDDPIGTKELKTILMKLNLKPAQVIRTHEEMYRKELKGKVFNDEEWIGIILQHPRLLQRPIVEGKYKAVVAIPPERIQELK